MTAPPAATAAAQTRDLDATRHRWSGNDAATNSGRGTVNASPSNPAPPVLGLGISQENNFDAWRLKRSIEGMRPASGNRAQIPVWCSPRRFRIAPTRP